jgi:cytochrome c biogenesis protein CcmG/thiol:disulfide interchange protein DsbE
MKSLRFFIPLLVLVALVIFLGAGLKLNPKEVPSPLIGKPSPEFNLPRLDNAAVNVRREDMLGKVWMLNVWASWCVACRDEHPLLVEFRKIGQFMDELQGRSMATKWLFNFNPYDFAFRSRRTGIGFGVRRRNIHY